MRDEPGPADERERAGPRWRVLRRLVAVQAVVLGPMIYLWLGPASETAAANPGPDLGAGLVGLVLMVLGLPWSVFVCLFDNRYGMFDSGWRDLFVIGPAVVNFGLAALSLWWTARHPVDDAEWQVVQADDLEESET
ncbi:hypothetical protein CLV67_107263 [Actinoplanes italicus]|uniref:Uncharacterized protein n=2 Tax=Actinoplanes italicus TaxID=113567 RepID=A0A2T0KDJ6_9ACTN|nr:hypothetical protein CLV67_107263 [Actinoplanes italicus]